MNHPTSLVGVGGSGLNTLAALNRRLASDPSMRDRMANDIYYLAGDKSLDYWQEPDVRDCLQTAERENGESIFAPTDLRHPYGYVSPRFVRDPKVSALRWKPWTKGMDAKDTAP